MLPTILVVDDDPYTRQLIRRVLLRDFEVRLFEAAHGVAALEVLLHEHVDIILLDVSMPVMDGMDTLQAIRRSPEFVNVQVMILAGKAEEQQVIRLVQLGIAGFLVKPFMPTLLSDRVSRLLAQQAQARSKAASLAQLRLALHRRSRVMIVDRAPEFCEFFADLLGPLCEVEVASSVPGALSSCMESPPDAVFVGTVDRLIETEIFVRKIRDAHAERRVPVVGIATDEMAPQDRAGIYDAVIVRSYVAETLRASLRTVLTDGAVARWLLVPEGYYVDTFRKRANEHVGKALGSGLAAEAARPGWSFNCGRWVVTAVEFHVSELSWELCLQVPYETALRFASTVSGLSVDEVSEEGVRMALSLVAEDLGGVLRALATEATLEASCGEPRVSMAPTYTVRETRDPASATHWWLSCERGGQGVALGFVPLSGVPQGRPVTA